MRSLREGGRVFNKGLRSRCGFKTNGARAGLRVGGRKVKGEPIVIPLAHKIVGGRVHRRARVGEGGAEFHRVARQETVRGLLQEARVEQAVAGGLL